jgi:Xaa-Pro aminopeptidase
MNAFLHNRQRFSDALQGSVAVLSAYDSMQLSADMEADFLQEASFWWLTGIAEPGWRVIIESGSVVRATLVRPSMSEAQIAFNGSLSDDDAKNISGIQYIIEEKDFEALLRTLAKKHSVIYTPYNSDEAHAFVVNPAQKKLHAVVSRIFTTTSDCSKMLYQLRAIKTPEEIAAIKKAVKLTVAAFEQVRQNLNHLHAEYEVEAAFTHHIRSNGAHHAYQPIVAAGKNACTLHYNKNQSKIKKNELLLIDIGARVDGYAADVTRTYCLNPTKRQLAVHAAVEAASAKIISYLKPGVTLGELSDFVDSTLHAALIDLKLIENGAPLEAIHKYMPHSIGHGLGVDVHDRFAFSELKPGMVMTIEPGIYIPEEKIGVRIEDDILITDTGHQNLTARLSTKFS